MRIRVDLCGWEQQCCGPAYELNDIVTRDLFLPFSGELQGDADYIESHHDLLVRGVSVTGRVVGIEVLGPHDEFVDVNRLPGAAALCGVDEEDSGDIIDLATGQPLENRPDEFIVVLDVAEGTELPTERARSAS